MPVGITNATELVFVAGTQTVAALVADAVGTLHAAGTHTAALAAIRRTTSETIPVVRICLGDCYGLPNNESEEVLLFVM